MTHRHLRNPHSHFNLSSIIRVLVCQGYIVPRHVVQLGLCESIRRLVVHEYLRLNDGIQERTRSATALAMAVRTINWQQRIVERKLRTPSCISPKANSDPNNPIASRAYRLM